MIRSGTSIVCLAAPGEACKGRARVKAPLKADRKPVESSHLLSWRLRTHKPAPIT